MDYEVIVIGGGPCGLLAARDLAREGVKVLVVEKSQEIGYPVKCSGLFSVSGLRQLDVKLDERLICSTIRGGRFYSPGGREFLAYSNLERARVVERKLFDKELAKEAVRAGAELLLKTRALGLKREKKRVRVKVSRIGCEETLRAHLLIGADGAGSNIGRWAGIKRSERFVSAVQVEVLATEHVEEDVAEIYLGRRYAPGFYAWILPKGELFEVGVGRAPGRARPPRELLLKFMREHPVASGKINSETTLEFNKGAIPVGGPVETVSENVMLVGDAAGQTKASTGGGVVTGGMCSRIAARAAVKALEEEDYTAAFLREHYEKKWQEELGMEFTAHQFLRQVLDSATDSELDSLFQILVEERIPELMTRYSDTDRPLEFVKEVLKKDAILTWSQSFLDIRRELLGD